MVKLGNWHDTIGTDAENSPHREAPNRHIKGSKKYKEMIDRDSKNADRWKNLPFTFSKPPKRTRPREDIYHVCDSCHHISMVSRFRAGQVCKGCKSYASVNKDNTYQTAEELEAVLEEIEARQNAAAKPQDGE